MFLILLLMAALVSTEAYALDKLPSTVFGVYQTSRIDPEQPSPSDLISFVKFIGGQEACGNGTDSPPCTWRRITVEFYVEDNNYFTRYEIPPKIQIELPFKLGEFNTATIEGRNIKYRYTAEGNETDAIVHMNYYEENGSRNFSIEAKFDESGIESILERKFFRMLPPYARGAYINNPEKTSSESRDLCNRFVQLPKTSFSWNDKLQVFLNGNMNHGQHLHLIFVHPYDFHQSNFTIGEKQQAVHRIVESTLDKTVMHVEKNDLVYEMAFDRTGYNFTAVINGTKHICGIFKPTVIPHFLGTFKRSPDKLVDPKWDEFIKGYEEYFQVPESITLEQKGSDYHVYDKPGGNFDITFQMNVPQEIVTHSGTLVKFTVTSQDFQLLHADVEIPSRNLKYSIVSSLPHHRIHTSVYRGNQSARQWFSRIASPIVFGTFENVGEDTEEYKAFANDMGTPELLNKTYVEFINETSFMSLVKQLVRPSPKFNVDYEYFCDYSEVDGVPHIMSPRGDFRTPGRNYLMTSVIHPDGFSAYYVYGGDIQNGGEKIATRQFKRISPDVKL